MMRRRLSLFVLLSVLAGCAGPTSAPDPRHLPPHRPSAGEPAPLPSGPVVPPTASGDMIFDEWSQGFYNRALKAGLSPALLNRELTGLRPEPRIAALDSKQPEFSKPVSAYLAGLK